MIVIETKEELKWAKKKKLKEFEVIGPLAEKIKKVQKISTLSKGAAIRLAAAIGAGVVAVPITGGASLGASALTVGAGAEILTGVIIAAMSIGGIIIAYALFKNYNVEFSVEPDGVKVKMKRK